jgi:hypothetical protein
LQEGGVGGHFRGTAGGEESGGEKEAQHSTVVFFIPVQLSVNRGINFALANERHSITTPHRVAMGFVEI